MKRDRLYDILIMEDRPADIRLIQEALSEVKQKIRISVAMDGEQGLNFLYKLGEHADAPTPDLIFLDLNMPKKEGKEVLKEIKNNDDLKAIPVVVLTNSYHQSEILEVYKLHANSYVHKPLDYEDFHRAINVIVNFWLSIAEIPMKPD